jgi:hypothetical protein
VLEVALRGLIGHINTCASDIEFPAVIDATQALLLVSAKEERCSAVWTILGDQTNSAIAIAKRDQLLTE